MTLKIAFAFLVFVHGLIHLMGFVKAFKFAKINQLAQDISKPLGLLWLFATVLFWFSLARFLSNKDDWWIFATLAIILSQTMIFQSGSDAKFGTIANFVISLPTLVACMNFLPSSFKNTYKFEVKKRLNHGVTNSVLHESDLKNLPVAIQNYLRYVGAINKPNVYNFRLVFQGSMKRNMASNWMDISSEQYNFLDDFARLFLIRSSILGVPFDGLHAFVDEHASMKIRVASLFQVVDAKGEIMNQSETVTLFNDMCLFAPATLISKNIRWEELDSLTVKATFTHQRNRIAAILYFNTKGELINFISNDRFLSSNGKVYTNYKWSTPIKEYKDFNGRKIPVYGEAIWHMPEGEFTYARFTTKEVDYNLNDFK